MSSKVPDPATVSPELIDPIIEQAQSYLTESQSTHIQDTVGGLAVFASREITLRDKEVTLNLPNYTRPYTRGGFTFWVNTPLPGVAAESNWKLEIVYKHARDSHHAQILVDTDNRVLLSTNPYRSAVYFNDSDVKIVSDILALLQKQAEAPVNGSAPKTTTVPPQRSASLDQMLADQVSGVQHPA